jgi:hypothetical protein
LLSVLSTLRDVDLTDLSYEINWYIPRQQRYREELDLPISVALLASYLQRSVPENSLVVGELDLTRRIRPPENVYLAALVTLLAGPQRGKIKRVYISSDCAERLSEMRPEQRGPSLGEIVEIVPVGTLETLLEAIWPGLLAES